MDDKFPIFRQRLQLALQDKGMTQAQFVKMLGEEVEYGSSSLVSQWMQGGKLPALERLPQIAKVLDVSTDWLLGASDVPRQTDIPQQTYDGITWTEHIPGHLSDSQAEQARRGIELFHQLVIDQRRFSDVIQSTNSPTGNIQSWQFSGQLTEWYSAFRLALQVGAFAIVDVQRDEAIEDTLRKQFRGRLRQVFVSDTPSHDGAIIRGEYVAFLGAKYALPLIRNPRFAGIGHGYTMLRMALISASVGYFDNTTWIPLTVAHQKHINFHSADYIALVMTHRHQGSAALYLPYTYPDDGLASKGEIEERDEVNRAADNASVMFTSCNGPNRRSSIELANEASQFRTADFMDLGDMRMIYERYIKNTELESRFAGEILGQMIDRDGNPIEGEVQVRVRQSFYQVDLGKLKEVCERGGLVWMVASRKYKALPIYAAIQRGLCNAVVIDREIAEELLELNKENK